MGFHLVGIVDGRPVDLPLGSSPRVVGSGPEADLRLAHESVSRVHAEFRVVNDQVEVTDRRSRNGTFLAARRLTSPAWVSAGSEITFGSVALRLEATSDKDLEPALSFGPLQTEDTDGAGRTTSTMGLKPIESFTTHRLSHVLELVADNSPPMDVVQAVGAALFESLPVLEVEILDSSAGPAAVLYRAAREMGDTVDAEPVVSCRGDITVSLRFPHPSMIRAFKPVIDSAGLLIDIGVRRSAKQPSARASVPPPLPGPETVDLEVGRIYREAAAVAGGDVGVLICGESGTGKEVLARYIHSASPRASRPFVALNCAALPRDLLEAELFGIERGVATGVDARPGKFELADRGTLFLDEIGDMDLETQASILRVLQEGEVYRVGGSAPRSADVRIIAATNCEMQDLLDEGRFREDLYYRIATWEVTVPPLRHRRADIPNLAAFFLERAVRHRGARVAGISRGALEVLVAYRWPGNVRQMEKEMDRAALFVSTGGLLTAKHLSPKLLDEQDIPGDTPLGERLDAFERSQIERALRGAQGDVPATAKALGIGRSTLYRRIKALGIEAFGVVGSRPE